LYDAHGTPLAPQFTVSTGATSQFSAAPLANGGFAIAWEPNSPVGGVFAQLYDSSGHAAGQRLLADPSGYDAFVSVTVLGNGQFVVVWDRSVQNGDLNPANSVFGQLYNANGTRSGNQFTVTTDEAQTNSVGPKVLALGSNDFVTLDTVHHVSDLTAGEFLFV
jgi:hypothetical protein